MDKEGEIIEKAYRFQNNFPCAQIFEDKIVAAMITGQFLSIKIATACQIKLKPDRRRQ